MTRSIHWTFGQNLIAASAFLLLIGLAYSNSFRVPFFLDDFESIVNNQTIRNVGDLGTVLRPPTSAGVGGRPFLNLLFALDYAWSGLNPTGYHITNLCIHVLCAGFIFGVVRRTLLNSVSGYWSDINFLAWCICTLWALHPLNTISVTYISQRAESLMGLLFMAAMYCFIRSTASILSTWWQVASFALLTVGVLVKEQAAVAPLLFLLYDRAFVAGSFRLAWSKRGKFYLATPCLWILLGASLTLSPRQQIGTQDVSSLRDYLITDAEAVIRYIKLSFFPYPLIFDYGTQTTPPNMLGWMLFICIVCLVVASIILLYRAPAAGFLAAWFLVILAPTTTFIPIKLQPIAENRVYLPSVAVITAIILFAVPRLGHRVSHCFALLALVGALGSWSRNYDYRTELALWQDTVTKRPTSARVHLNLGLALVHVGRIEEGAAEYRRALSLRPDYMRAHYNLGCILQTQRQVREAAEEFTKAILLQPGYAPAYNNLGLAQQELGQWEAAVETLRKGVALDPHSVEMEFNFGNSLLGAGKPNEALEAFTKAADFRPELSEIYLQRARALRALRRYSEARANYEEALKRRPGWVLPEKELRSIMEISPP